jgi:CubicO group peptidase (beta-lactamase class C family)
LAASPGTTPLDSRLSIAFDEKKVDAVFAEMDQCHQPGAAIGIAIEGRPVYRKGFGLANMDLPVALTPTTRMRIGSTTKQFTAFAYMLLCERGKAGIDDPIGEYLPDLHPTARQVTARQLMTNTSGLRDVCDIKTYFSGLDTKPVTRDNFLEWYREIDDINAAPGVAWIYNNGGWVLLGAAIETITEKSLEEVLRTEVFEPIGMYDSLLRRWDTDFVSNSATTHHPAFRHVGFEKIYYNHDYAGAGAIVSTVNDMLRWLGNMAAQTIGTHGTWKAMMTPHRLPNGTSTGYGFGLMIDSYHGLERLRHAGGWTGGTAQIIKVPALQLDIALMINRGDLSAATVADKVLDACVEGQSPVLNTSREPAHGTYRSPVTRRIVQLFFKDGQQFASIDGMDLPVSPDTAGDLWPIGQVAFFRRGIRLRGNPANPDSIELSDFGNLDELFPLEEKTGLSPERLAARYESASTNTVASIVDTPDGPRLRTIGRFGVAEFTLQSLAEDVWRAKTTGPRQAYSGMLSFDADAAGFWFGNFCTRSLRFVRRS